MHKNLFHSRFYVNVKNRFDDIIIDKFQANQSNMKAYLSLLGMKKKVIETCQCAATNLCVLSQGVNM